MVGVLDGVRVLDFGRYIAGPYCTTMLGFLGAEVIRIEKRAGGEDRYVYPLYYEEDGTEGSGSLFNQVGVNKKSVTLNPASDEGREIVKKLVATADVVVANLPMPSMKHLELDYDSLVQIKPDIIQTSISTFGPTGPYAERGGFDGIGQVMSGAAWFAGTEDGGREHPNGARAPAPGRRLCQGCPRRRDRASVVPRPARWCLRARRESGVPVVALDGRCTRPGGRGTRHRGREPRQ
jgi:crotonobetainyl-CoA:carnitine CoA-transferase CaiB-like acyl-CoA transferase